MKGRKVDVAKKATINTVFTNAKNRLEFVTNAKKKVGISEATATVYWYNLCKATGRVVVEKRGRKPAPKVGYTDQRVTTVTAYVTAELEKAKATKKSTVVYRTILDMLG